MKNFIKYIIISTFLIFSIIFFFVYITLPRYNNTIHTDFVNKPVEIYRDSYGMPIIFAENEEDLAFAIGYAMAQDRIFQMDLIRRVIQGKLSEILGEYFINTDKFFLTITSGRSLEEIYKNHPENIQKILQQFSKGINYFIQNNYLPIEFYFLGYKPQEWKPEDSLSIFYYMCFDLNTAFDTEILFYLLVQKFGYLKAKELFPDYVPKKGEILHNSRYADPLLNIQLISLLNTIDQIKDFLGSERIGASNNWVISSKKSMTNTPILASDMHLGFGLPGIWYEAQLITPEMNVSGVLLPGIPFVVVGANENIAWAFTNVMADDADFYIEKLNPDNENQYLYRAQYKDFEVIKKIFKTKNKNQIEEEEFLIRKTIHGPIINSIYPIQTKELFSLKWTAYDHYYGAIALYLVNKAKNFRDIEEAIKYFKAPGQNWVYADKEGNIGFTAAVGIPIRNGFNGLLPMPGWTGTYEWAGYVTTNLQPRIINPEEGWIATANNKHSSKYPYIISNYYHYPDRYERIKEYLQSKEKFSIEDMINLQKDKKFLLAEELLPIFLQELSNSDFSNKPESLSYIEELKKWNFETDIDSIGCSIFHVFLQRVLYNTFFPHLGEELYKQYLKKQFIPVNALRMLLKQNNSDWFDNPETPEKETKKDILYKSFLEAIEILKNFSKNTEDWQWGNIHTLKLQHPFGKNTILDKIFNKGPYKVYGSISTVNPMDFSLYQTIPYQVRSGASERLILLPGKINESLRIIPTGISGNPFSKYYGNQTQMFLKHQYRKFELINKETKKDFTYTGKIQILPMNQ